MIVKLFQEYKEQIKSSRKGLSDVFVSVLPQGVSLFTGLITSILLARGLGPAELGRYALVISVSAMITSLSDLGIGQTAIRYASRCLSNNDEEGHRAVLRWSFRIRILLVMIVSFITYLFTPLIAGEYWHDESLSSLIRASLWIAFFGAVASAPAIYFQSLKRFRANAAVMISQSLLLLVGMLFLEAFHTWSTGWVIAISVAVYGINAIAFLLFVPKDAIFKMSDFGYLKNGVENYFKSPKFKNYSAQSADDSTATVFAFYMMLSSAIVMLVVKADVWLMGYFIEPQQIGIYNAASRVALPLMMLIAAVNTVLWPRTSNLRQQPDIRKFVRGIFLLSGLAAGVGLIYAWIAPFFIPMVFGEAYRAGIFLGQLISVRYCLSIFLSPLGIIGYSFGFVRYIWLINIVQLIAVIGINFWLLPKIGPVGSAIALISVEVISGIFTIPLLWYKMKKLSIAEMAHG
jgi:O-antigen/teichoic acid export membrane protein